MKTYLSAIGWVSILAAISKLLAFVRELLIAAYFGVSADVDVYLVARFIPITAPILVVGSFNAALIPVLTKHLLQKDRKGAWECLNGSINFLLLSSGLFLLFGLLFTKEIVRFLAPFFSGEQLDFLAYLTRIGLLSLPFSIVGVCLNAAFHAENRFILPAISSILPNLATVLCLVLLSPRIGVTSLIVGLLLGEIFRFLLLLPFLLLSGWRLNASFSFRFLPVQFWRIAGFSGGIVLLAKSYSLVDLMLASKMAEGSIAALGFASRAFTLVYEVFAVSVATVLFPTMALQAAQLDGTALKRLLKRGIFLLTLIALPLTAILFAFAHPFCGALFQRGHFGESATGLTASAMRYFSLQLLAAAFLSIVLKAYYSIGNASEPLLIALFAFSVGVALKVIMAPILGIKGLALATGIVVNLNAFIALYLLFLRIRNIKVEQTANKSSIS